MQSDSERKAAEAKALLHELVVEECYRRAKLYDAMRLAKNDSPERKQEKVQFLLLTLQEWKADPARWLNDMAWAPDPKGAFGSKAVPDELAGHIPRRMVPFIPYPKQLEVAREFDRACRGDEDCDIGLLKSRQVAMTTMMMWMGLREWLFWKDSPGVMGTYEESLIDPGGKGQRDAGSLFGRLRLFLDAMIHALPALRFNGDIYAHRGDRAAQAWRRGSGLESHEDIVMKLKRPRWVVHGNDIFPEAKGNVIEGKNPGDSFARSQTYRWAMLDELGQYNEKQEGRDRDAWNACTNNVSVRVGWGTIGKKAPTQSLLYDLTTNADEDDFTLRPFFVHWTDIVPYMAAAEWKCRACREMNPHPVQPGPGPKGHVRGCGHCGRDILVRWKDMTSPWYVRTCLRMKNDKIGIARELDMDWMASAGDTFFSLIDPETVLERTEPRPNWVAIDGLDPGNSIENPAAWISMLLDPATMKLHVVGYWMAANAMIEYFIPFIKRWSSYQTRRMRLVYGKHAGRTFADAFQYTDEAYEMMDHLAKLGVPLGDVYGDKFGSHRNMVESAYDVLYEYGISVNYEYTKDREALVRHGQEWAARLAIDDRIADVRPLTPLNKRYPSVHQVFTTAKPRPVSGQGEYKVDVDKQSPPHVNHACDAYFYACRALYGEQIHASADPAGRFAVDRMVESEVVDMGGDELGF